MAVSTFLKRRNHTYYFRKRIPINLVAKFQKTEIMVSLHTANLNEAHILGAKMLSEFNKHISQLRQSMTNNPYWIVESDVEDKEVDTTGWNSDEQIIISTTAPDGTKTEMIVDHGGDIEAERETAKQLLQVNNLTQSTTPLSTIPTQSLEFVVGKYLKSKKSGGTINAKSLETYSNSLALLVEYFGAKADPKSIKLEKAEEFRNILMQLPPNRKKKKELKGLSLQHIVKKGLKPQSPTTVKGCLERCSTFFDWLVKADYADKNYFHKMTVPSKRKKESDDRDRWATTDLQKLFSHKIYTKHDFEKAYQFWVPLLGLYMGGRVNELSQVYIDDIKQINGIWCISISDEREHQRLKTANSARIIPIHQQLIDLGFMEYVQSRSNEVLLFDHLFNSKGEVARDGLGSNVGKWFNRFIKRLGINDAVFHSFRHTIADEFKQNEVPETQAMAILGHKNQSITYARYAKDLNVSIQQKTIQTLDFSDVISAIKNWN